MQVQAYAGCGKTTALVLLARANRHLNVAYICFNKDMQQDAVGLMPKYVQTTTLHAVAYAWLLTTAHRDRPILEYTAPIVGPLGVEAVTHVLTCQMTFLKRTSSTQL